MSQPAEQAGHSLVLVAESAVALARAELKLAISEGKVGLARLGPVAVLVGFGILFTQVSVLLIALSPILLGFRPWPMVLLSVELALIPAVLCFLGARRYWRRARRVRASD